MWPLVKSVGNVVAVADERVQSVPPPRHRFVPEAKLSVPVALPVIWKPPSLKDPTPVLTVKFPATVIVAKEL